MPFLSEGYEGVDINDPKDWWYVEHLLDMGAARLPTVEEAPFPEEAATAAGPDQ